MTDPYAGLLDATIAELEAQKLEGVRFVSVSPDVLAALAAPVPRGQIFVASAPGAAAAAVSKPSAIAAAGSALVVPVTPVVANYSFAAPTTAAESANRFSAAAVPASPQIFSSPPPPPPPVVAPVVARVEFVPPPPVKPNLELFTGPVPSLGEKMRKLAELRARALECQQCPHLAASRRNVVFGVGNPEAALMFVGEAPGAEEDAQGEPFVGAAGQTLTKMIQAMGFARELVYIANLLKCRPDTPGQSFGNRKPTPEEMDTCLPYLWSQIETIRPRVLVTLGATATQGLLRVTPGINQLRGHWQNYRGIPVMPTFHPSYLLHKPDLSEKRKVWEDMLLVLEKLDMPISEKQRGFFLPKSGGG